MTGVLEALNTGDQPIKVLAEDGKIYLIKHKIREDLQPNLIREYICYQIFKSMEVSIPEATLLYFEPVVFENELKPLKGRFIDQVVLGFEWMEARDLKDELYKPKPKIGQQLVNASELADILVMDIWLKNNDRAHDNLNMMVSDRKLYAIDHGATFDQESFNRLADPDRKNCFVEPGDLAGLLSNTNYFEFYFDQYTSEFEKAGLSLCDDIAQIDEVFIEEVVESVPDDWNFSEEERQSTFEYLNFRKDKLHERFLGHLNFGRQRR